MLLILLSDTTQHFCLHNQTHDESVSSGYGSHTVSRHLCEDHFNQVNGWMNLSGISFVPCINLNKILMKMLLEWWLKWLHITDYVCLDSCRRDTVEDESRLLAPSAAVISGTTSRENREAGSVFFHFYISESSIIRIICIKKCVCTVCTVSLLCVYGSRNWHL